MARYEAKLDIGGEFEASFSLPLFTGDSGNSVALEFYNRGKPYDMSGAVIYARRGDGTVLATSGVTEGNKAEFTLYNNMYVYPGELQVQVSIVDVYGNFLTSGVLYFTVQEGFSGQSEGEGSNDFCELTSLIRQVGEGLGHIERAEQAANEIEAALANRIIDDVLDGESENPVQNKVLAPIIWGMNQDIEQNIQSISNFYNRLDNMVIDDALSDTSENPVMNCVLNRILRSIQEEADENHMNIASLQNKIGYLDTDLTFGKFNTVVDALNVLCDKIGTIDSLTFGNYNSVAEALDWLYDNSMGMQQYLLDKIADSYTSMKNYVDEQIGDISTVLTEIEALQNSYIGGDSV